MEIEGEISMMLDLNWFMENKQLISLETIFPDLLQSSREHRVRNLKSLKKFKTWRYLD